MAVGNRVFLKRPLVSNEILEEFKQIPTANIADCMGRLSALHPRISLKSSPTQPIAVGRALTVKARSGDNLMIHKALNMAEEGDVIIISNDGGNDYRSLMGEIMFAYGIYKKIAGVVIDGPIRDSDAVKSLTLPIYATGTNPAGPYKDGTGEINTPIACGGIAVDPGDIIVMDRDGVIVVPYNDADEVLEGAKEKQALDAANVHAALTGTVDRDWVEKAIKEQGTEIIDAAYSR
ncbi:RraA family protein [uncultured Veillonella sp.]|uniref:RraA family protein n=1 Tax=uncultured Veillonella sp. TaxID=159268 RepID=UPI0025ED808A|nr:RraA family protein [uncultured Veillonella sp.]MDY3974185.1 RraA family protein [Veillonella caviae]